MNKKNEKVQKDSEVKEEKKIDIKKTSSFKKKKKVKKNITSGIAYVYSTFNNTIISIADENGPTKSLVVVGISAWTVGQLDGEIDKGHWNLSEVKEELIFEEDNEIKFIKATNDSFLRL